MILEIPRENVDTLFEKTSPSLSEDLRDNVINARKIQQERYRGTQLFSNATLTSKEIHTYITLDTQAELFLKQAAQKMHLS